MKMERVGYRSLFYIEEYPDNDTDEYFLLTCADSSYTFSTYMHNLNLYYMPIMMVCGIFGNILSCLVLLLTHLKLRSSSYYLAALSLADSGFLLCTFIVYCSTKKYFELYDQPVFCQATIYLTYVFSFLSVWFIVAFTVERFIAIQYPLRRPYICTVSRAKTIISILTSIALLLYLFSLWVTDVIDEECKLKPEYTQLVEMVNYADTIGTLIVPVILIVGMNIMIARSLFKFRKAMQLRMKDDGSCRQNDLCLTSSSQSNSFSKKSRDNQNQNAENPGVETICTVKGKYSHVCGIRKFPSKHATSNTQHSINRMLLIISTVFITLNTPSYLIRLCYYFDSITQLEIIHIYFSCFQQLSMILYYTNFGINFLLYTMCGKAFRISLQEFMVNILRKLGCIRGNNFVNNNL